ncbi:phosphotransferase family protein [Novosphingobium sp.]|uniref:phosphotransferase family protein n=1 Tax=Novosphingobium sp. TaxID=1874826 RepID=UPI0027375E86|nr:aminoglycoside phosphotransferase family protein [Novosphingobium sp.]MDP3908571.1 aminoglycoside phosphotransferase family protein [Novosphingobium sp.]
MSENHAAIAECLRRAGLLAAGELPVITALSGGVSCDVFRIDTAAGTLCAKRALPRLRVATVWEAPVDRSHYEVEWLAVARAAGLTVPRVIAELADEHVFFMDWFPPEDNPVWKAELAAGRIDPGFAAAVGHALAAIHTATRADPAMAERFPTDALFTALRIEPYLLHTARAHPDLADVLEGIARQTLATRDALVHGDVSPKNILCGRAGPVLIDAECAWYGDPAFDLAFCATHLLLKGIWHPQWQPQTDAAFAALHSAYLGRTAPALRTGIEQRTIALLAAILLARIDGRSPVEYLTAEADRDRVRRAARELLQTPPTTLAGFGDHWRQLTGHP